MVNLSGHAAGNADRAKEHLRPLLGVGTNGEFLGVLLEPLLAIPAREKREVKCPWLR